MIGEVVGLRYEVQQELETNALFGSFKAMDRQSGKEVRLRVLDSGFADEPDFVSALAEHAGRLKPLTHPAVERIIDTTLVDQRFVLVSDYVQAVTLDERIKRLASFSVQLAVSTAVAVCEALVAVHQAGMIHGDISGRNVLVTPSGSVRLTMAGFWATYAHSTKAGMAMLRPMAPYLAPEITAGSMPSVASDVYALGVLLYQMLSGRFPFAGDTAVAIATKHASAPYPSLRTANPSVPEALDELIRKCLSKAPSERYANTTDLLADLRGIQDALRFGRPLTWPIRRDATEPLPVAPNVDDVEPMKRKQQTKKAARTREASDDMPKWLIGIVVLFAAGLFAAIGSWVWFNTHQPKLIDLPNIVSKTTNEAAQELQKIGLRLSVESHEASDKYPSGVVIKQDPQPGKRQVKEGGIVQVVVSSGGLFVAVPDLRGRSIDEARRLLAAIDLDLSEDIVRVRDKDLAEGMIVSQVPEPDRKVERGSRIRIKVSNGDTRVSDDASSDERYTYKLKVTMPEGAAPVTVRIDMTDDRETQTILEEEHNPGDVFDVEHDGYGKEVLFRIFFDNELVKQINQKASDADKVQQ